MSRKHSLLLVALALALCALSGAREGTARDPTSGGPTGGELGSSSAAGAGQQQPPPTGGVIGSQLQQLIASTPGQMAMQYGMSPLGQSIKYLMPNAYQGATTDLTNGYYMANKGYNGIASQFSSMSDNLMSRYHSMQAGLVESLQQQVARQDALLKQMYEMVANPEQLCRDLATQTKEATNQAGQMAQQAEQQSSSFMNKWIGK